MHISEDHSVYIKNLPFPSLLLNNLGVIDVCSAITLTFLNVKNEDLIGKDIYHVFSLERPEANNIFFGGNHSENGRYVVSKYKKDKKIRSIQLNFYPLPNSTSEIVILEDVSKKAKQFEMAMQAKRTAKIGVWEVDLIEDKVYWSEVTKEIHEVPQDFVPDIEKGINFYKKGESRDKIVEVVSNGIENGTGFDVELQIITYKGKEKWVRAIGNVERNNGKSTRLFGVFQDIDLRKREQEKYQELHDRMRIAVESANIGIWDFNLVKDDLVWDDNMYKLYGVNKEDFDGHFSAWEKTVHPDDKEKAIEEVNLAIEGTKDFNTSFRVIKGDGTVSTIKGEGKVFRDSLGNPIRMIGANSDISEITRTQKRLTNLLKVTESQNKSLLNFAHIVSHNLRSNTSNLSTLTGMLLENISTEDQNKFIEMIKVSAEKLDETIIQLNEVIKIREDYGKHMRWIPIKPCFDNALESINAHIDNINLDIQYNIPDEQLIYAVKPYLASIFLNLLTNSIKYRNKEKKLIIKVNADIKDNFLKISFKDNGLGIDMERHGKYLFGMYKTFHGNKDAKGIGLFMTKNQLEAMSASIEVISEVDNGAEFVMNFKNFNRN